MVRYISTRLSACSLALSLGACSTQFANQDREARDPVLTEDCSTGRLQDPAEDEPDPAIAPPEKPRYLAYTTRLLNPAEPFRPGEDEGFLLRIPDYPASGSPAEAAAFVGLVRNFIWLRQGQADSRQKPAPEEGQSSASSLAIEEDQQHLPGPASLEQMAESKGVDLPAALKRQPILRAPGFQLMILKALRMGRGQSAAFLAGLKDGIKDSYEEWSRLSQELEAIAGEGGGQVSDDDSAPEDSGHPPPLAFGEEVFSRGESRLKEAQALANQQQYAKALTVLRGVSEDSLYTAEARSKIREISNIAVQHLRSKAAKAFQTTRSISDQATRMAYLRDAKKYLEEALEEYQESDQLHTVRQNLSVINEALK